MSIKTLQFSNKPNICCCIWSFAFVFTIWIWITNEHKKWKKGKKMENIVKKTMKIWKNRKNIAITQTKNECELNRNILLVFFFHFCCEKTNACLCFALVTLYWYTELYGWCIWKITPSSWIDYDFKGIASKPVCGGYYVNGHSCVLKVKVWHGMAFAACSDICKYQNIR